MVWIANKTIAEETLTDAHGHRIDAHRSIIKFRSFVNQRVGRLIGVVYRRLISKTKF